MIIICVFQQITKDSVILDETLLTKFKTAVQELVPDASLNAIERVHGILLAKIYNATSNEFVRTITKLNCIKEKKAVDTNMGLRDKLKSYAIEKGSLY